MLTLTALSISQDTKYLTEFKDGICKMQGKMSFTDEASLVATFIANECNNDYRMKKRTPAKYCHYGIWLTNYTALELEYTSLAVLI
jgi:hypothetical protein